MLESSYRVLVEGFPYVLFITLLIKTQRRKRAPLFFKVIGWSGVSASVSAGFLLYTFFYTSLEHTFFSLFFILRFFIFSFLLGFSLYEHRRSRSPGNEDSGAPAAEEPPLFFYGLFFLFFFLLNTQYFSAVLSPMLPIFDSLRSSARLSSSVFGAWSGMALGFFLLILSGVLIAKGAERAGERTQDRFFLLLLSFFVLTSFLRAFSGWTELTALNLKAGSMTELMVMGIGNHRDAPFYIFLLFCLIAFWISALRPLCFPADGVQRNPAERRKIKASLRRTRFRAWNAAVYLFFLSSFSLYGRHEADKEVRLRTSVAVKATGQKIFLDPAVFEDNRMHRYVWTGPNEVAVPFFIIKKRDGVYGVVFDGCDICGPAGYYEKGRNIVCILCNVIINRNTIGLRGGCNPIPLKFGKEAGKIVIQTGDLMEMEGFFSNVS